MVNQDNNEDRDDGTIQGLDKTERTSHTEGVKALKGGTSLRATTKGR